MCGISGIIKKDNACNFKDIVNKIPYTLTHRGPDHFGYYLRDDFFAASFRLSIIDRAAGNQPVWDKKRNLGIVYNGEVYNYLELRKELAAKGHKFSTCSDTEVVLKLYEEYGVDAFKKLNGMFALCIWDNNSQEIILARDHFGIKPLYIYEDASQIIFSSEVKGIVSLPGIDLTLSPEGIQDYLIFRYIQSPLTLFKKIESVVPGSYVKIKTKNLFHYPFWDFCPVEEKYNLKKEVALEELDGLLKQSIQSQLQGDVPIGVLLSGGLDSSTIAYYVAQTGAQLKTFNIGFKDCNEFEYSRAVAEHLGLENIEILTSVEELAENYEKISWALDHPIADPACLPLYLLCSEAKKHVKVLLSGEDADQIFAGSNQYKTLLKLQQTHVDSFEKFLEKGFYFLDGAELLKQYRQIAPHYLRSRKYFQEHTLLNSMLIHDLKTYSPDSLMMKSDKMLMSHSLEGRFPFLDQHLLSFAFKLPEKFKISTFETKCLLKERMKNRLPDKIIYRSKMGFTVPIGQLLEQMKDKVFLSLQLCQTSELMEITDANKINSLVNHYYQHRCNFLALKIWNLFTLMNYVSSTLTKYQTMDRVSLDNEPVILQEHMIT